LAADNSARVGIGASLPGPRHMAPTQGTSLRSGYSCSGFGRHVALLATGSGVKRRINLPVQQHAKALSTKAPHPGPCHRCGPRSCHERTDCPSGPLPQRRGGHGLLIASGSPQHATAWELLFLPTHLSHVSMNITQSAFEGQGPILHARQGGQESALPRMSRTHLGQRSKVGTTNPSSPPQWPWAPDLSWGAISRTRGRGHELR
jgi:hypothetical protein